MRNKLFKIMDGIDNIILKLEEVFLVLVTIALVGAIFIEVVCRYVFFISTAWSEELARYLFVALTFLGSSYAYARREHIEIDIITQVCMKIKAIKDKDAMQRFFRILANFTTMAFIIVFFRIFSEYLGNIAKMKLLSPTMHLPMIYVYGTVSVGCIMTIVHGVFMLIRDMFPEKTDAPENEEVAE